MTKNLKNSRRILFISFSMACLILFHSIAAYGKEISFRSDDQFSSELQTALKENQIFFKYQPYGYFTIESKNAESFIAIALGVSDNIFGESDTPIPYEDMQLNRSGYMNKNGQIIIEPTYVVAKPFGRYDIAAAADEIEWKYIDPEGKTILKPYLFDNGPDYFKEGLSRYVENNLIGFIDETYQVAIRAQYEFVTPFHNNYATFCVGCKKVLLEKGGEHVKREGGKWGAINKKGEVVVEPIYDSPVVFEAHKAKVTLNNQTFYIDESGNSKNRFYVDNPADKGGHAMTEEIIKEIEFIDRNALEMAESVLKNPLLRASLEKGCGELEDRLLALADELEKIDPAAYATVADKVSESLLDLAFVQMDTDMVSLRLGQLIEQQK